VHAKSKVGMGPVGDMGHYSGAMWQPIQVGPVFIDNSILFVY
jgi:hypothetical protein